MSDVDEDLRDLAEVWRLRAFEQRVRELRLAGDVVGSVHLDIGQEAVPVGICGLIGPDDALFATYRGHGYALGRGADPEQLFAELLGRQTGINGGRGGSAYLSAPRQRFFGENSIVGAHAPIACGAALAGRYDGTDRVAVAVFGDGAMNQGAVHEALNFAAALRLAVIFVCVNNGWSELTPIEAMVGEPRLYRRGSGYGIPSERIDGNDPAVVRERVADAFELAREGGGPTLLEAMTARLAGHYIGDAELYRREGELEAAREREPAAVLTRRLAAAGVDPGVLAGCASAARHEMNDASERALLAPLADPGTATEAVYV